MTDKQILMFIGLPIGIISMFLIWKIIKIYKNMKRKLKPVFEPVKEFMHEVKSDFKEFAGDVSFHFKCKVWGQRTDTVQQFKEPGQRSVPRIF